MNSFLEHVFKNRGVLVFIPYLWCLTDLHPGCPEVGRSARLFDRRHGIVVLLPHLLLGFWTETSPHLLQALAGLIVLSIRALDTALKSLRWFLPMIASRPSVVVSSQLGDMRRTVNVLQLLIAEDE